MRAQARSKRVPRRPKMAPRGLQGGSKGPELAVRWLRKGRTRPTWLTELSRALLGPSQTSPGSDFGTHFGPILSGKRGLSLLAGGYIGELYLAINGMTRLRIRTPNSRPMAGQLVTLSQTVP